MLLELTPNLILMIAAFTFIGVYSELQILFFATLTDPLNFMINETLIHHYGINPTTQSISLTTSIVSTSGTFGMLISTFLLIPYAESHGRKFVCVHLRFITGFLSSLCHLGAAVFQSIELFIIGQIVNYANIPIRLYITVIYVSECAPDKRRGFAATTVLISNVIGQLIMFSITSPKFLGTTEYWFVLPLITAFLSILLFVTTIRLPDSPKWLVRMNRMEEAKQAIVFYQGRNCDKNETLISHVKEKNLTKNSSISLRDIYENETLLEAFKLVLAVDWFMKFNPNGVESTFAMTINKAAGFSTQSTLNINLIFTILAVPARFAGTLFLDFFGRRPVLFLGAGILYSKIIIMAVAQWLSFEFGPSVLAKCLLVPGHGLLDLYSFIGVGALDTILICELFPPSARNVVIQFLTIFGLVSNFPLTLSFPLINVIFPPAFYAPFIIFEPLLVLYLFRNLPETSNRSICDIIASLDQEVTSRHCSVFEENIPLIRDRARTLANKRGSILNTTRTRALSYDHKLIPASGITD